jgi:hypothetical protein
MDERLKYFPDMIVDLEELVDDLVANGAPAQAVQHVQEAVRICREYQRRAQSEGQQRP